MQNTNIKFAPVIRPQAIFDNTSPTSVCVDTLGAKYVIIKVELGATDIALTAMKIQESNTLTDANTLSGGADITGLDFTGSYPSATDDNKMYLFMLPTLGRKRYLDLILTVGDGTAGAYVHAEAILFDNERHNYDITSYNVAAIKSIP